VSVNTVGTRSPISGFATLLGGAILTFLFLIVATSEFGWLLGIPIHGFVLPTALLGSCLVTGWGARIYFPRPFRVTLVVAGLVVILVAASAWISLAFYDVSFDGQAYHQEGVYQLAHGWNPLFTPYISPISIDQDVKLIHFPKGPWIIAAAMYRLTGRIETGKFVNILLVAAAFSMALAVFPGFSRRMKKPLERCRSAGFQPATPLTSKRAGMMPALQGAARRLLHQHAGKELGAWPLAMAMLVAANPVALCQIFTFYVDGQMASLLACLATLCFLSADGGHPWVNLLLFEAAVLIIQLKFTGLVYVTIFLAGFITLLAWQKRPLRKHLYVGLLALGLGTCVFGKNPYVFNILENGHPFYPFFGRGDFAKITMTNTTPPAFLEANRVVNLAASISSRSGSWPPQSDLKAPWQINRGEWAAFAEPDALTGGFGPLFAAALVFSLALLAMGVAKGGTAPRVGTAVILIIVASVLPVSACWWARYAPQIWLVPLVALAPLAGAFERPNLQRLSWLVLLILSANVAGIARVNFLANLNATRETAASLADLRSHASFKVAFGYFRSNRFRLQEAGIPFIEVEGHLRCDPEVKENDDFCIEH